MGSGEERYINVKMGLPSVLKKPKQTNKHAKALQSSIFSSFILIPVSLVLIKQKNNHVILPISYEPSLLLTNLLQVHYQPGWADGITSLHGTHMSISLGGRPNFCWH